ncbi:hypothetical protein GCK72_017475 [Caenorhabditis remanei]|uniref:Uncharacterized protein n=1 Tax=Caenorhabditis remanei TaxID=31234 RepID=A0A6A5G8K0_CAERE|nr:hypothetical protein GCK72_017475 [Caenorhabditis remanei]KAF1750924.1 hypothetical protein GCK72_017475 [Caenorhabditis remanei]
MASRLKNRQRTAQLEQSISTDKSTESNQQTDRRPSTTKEDGDEFPAAPNIAAKIAQRRLPRRTPTSHVKGASGDLIRRRLSKTNDEQGSSRSSRFSYGSSFEKSFDEPDKKIPEEESKPAPLQRSSGPVVPSSSSQTVDSATKTQ